MKQIKNVHIKEIGFHEGLQRELSTYPEKTVNKDRSVTIEQINNPYFLINDKWNIYFLGEINQFKEVIENYKSSYTKNIHFRLNNPLLNLEVKYVYYQQLFRDLWTVTGIFSTPNGLNRMTEFLNEKYPKLSSLLELDIDKVEREYLFWLNEKGINTKKVRKRIIREDTIGKSSVVVHLRTIYTAPFQYTDKRDEWEKDKWDVRILHDKYGIDYNKSKNSYYLDFSKTDQKVREEFKKYCKQRLLSKNKFSWSTAQRYVIFLSRFFTFVFSIEPMWKDLKSLKRSHIEKYIEYLHEYTKNNIKRCNSHPEGHLNMSLSTIQKFLEEIQRYEYDMAPETHVRLLIFPEDKPQLKKKSIDQIDYIPDYVLEQLFTHINDLHKDIQPVVWIAFKTGLRISDVLLLKSDCLVLLNGNYSIVTDVKKTFVEGHRMPIDEHLAGILAVLIEKSKELSNQDNNPEGYIFIRYRGQRKGKPFSQSLLANNYIY